MSIVEEIKQLFPMLSKRKQKVATYIVNNMEEAAYSTASAISLACGVSEPTVLRLAADLGFQGYKHMQRSLQQQLKQHYNIVERYQQFSSNCAHTADSFYTEMLQREQANINETILKNPPDKLERIADKIVHARNIGIAGFRVSVGASMIFQILLNQIKDNVFLLQPGAGDSFDRILNWDERDLIIGSAFYTGNHYTYDLMDFASKRNCQMIAFTDSPVSSICKFADEVVELSISGRFVSMSSYVYIINLLLCLVSEQMPEQSLKKIQAVETVFEQYLK